MYGVETSTQSENSSTQSSLYQTEVEVEVSVGKSEYEAPSATFFAELPPERVLPCERGRVLQELFLEPLDSNDPNSPVLAEYLKEKGHAISLAMSTLDESTAHAVRILNEYSVPVIGWVVLDQNKWGYFTNRATVDATRKRTEQILRWRDEYGISFVRVGLDSEKPLSYLSAINKLSLAITRQNVKELIQAIRDHNCAKARELEEYGDPQDSMDKLLGWLQIQGIQTEAYIMPRFSQRLLGGGLQMNTKETIQMLYTSPLPAFFRPFALHFLRDCSTVPALGIMTGIKGETPGVDLTGGAPTNHLTSKELERDIRVLLRQGMREPGGIRTVLSDLYVFAMNSLSVPRDFDTAVEKVVSSKS